MGEGHRFMTILAPIDNATCCCSRSQLSVAVARQRIYIQRNRMLRYVPVSALSALFFVASMPALVALVAFTTGCKAKAETTTAPPVVRIHVDTVAAREQPMPRSLALTGTLRGQRQTDLAANAVGRVLETFVERGAEVKKGDLIARLDVRAVALSAAEAQANAALSRAQETTAKRECERYQRLLDSAAISQAEFDRTADVCRNSPLQVAAAEARASAAAQVVGDGSIRAPFGGRVTERFVEAGQYVRADTRVVSLVAVSVLRLELTVPEASISAVKSGGALTFTVPAYPNRTFSGTVRYVSPALRETTRDLAVEAEVDNADHALYPGMFAAIDLYTGEAPLPVVPRDTLLTKDGTSRVFAVVDRRLEERVVQPGVSQGDVVAVLRGVRPGDQIVVKPTEALLNGQAVDTGDAPRAETAEGPKPSAPPGK
jgi:membrane fusion protein (multidrug efflux system)